MTSFQRLLKGLNILNRYSGITEVDINEPSILGIPLPTSIKLDPKDVVALTKAGWSFNAPNWVFQS